MMNGLKMEVVYFWTAVMFFTRIPVPSDLPYSEEIMNRSQKYYPLTGWIVGGVYAFTFWIAQLLFGNELAVLLAISSGVLLTGAFHEDGFTDVCDAFGGGYGKEKILSIMKDSRTGAYGVVGIILLILLKVAALVQIADNSSIWFVVFTFIAANTISRFVGLTTVYTHKYVSDPATSKAKHVASSALPFSALFIGFITVLLVFTAFNQWVYLLVFPFAYLTKYFLAAYFKKHIGGYTGDCLGTIQQVSELVVYLVILGLWKFI